MRKITENFWVFGIGGIGYVMIELLWRGYSHWTMALTGGACFLFIYLLTGAFADAPVWKICFAGSLIITELELAVGFAVNILLGWNVWDYSDQPFNLYGQICLLYFVLWFLLCIPLVRLCGALRRCFARISDRLAPVNAQKIGE